MAEEPVESQDQFPPEVAIDVDGLVWLGHLSENIDFCGHTFEIRTLKGDEDLAAGLVAKEYIDSLGQARAWAWAKLALAIVSIDGRNDWSPQLGPDKVAFARQRFKYLTEAWYWPVAQFLYESLILLEQRQIAALDAMQGLSTGSRTRSTPSPDSSIDPGDLTETT